MKLRNKITNVICDAEAREDGIYLKVDWGDGEKWHKYGLGCLGDNWEYCVEPSEPLIKDEKIRKAVKMWADANGYDKLWVYHDRTTISFYNEEDNNNEIIFNTMEKFGLEHLKCYTVPELCGEEEE